MLFNSSEFLLAFLPIVLIVYYQLPHRGQNAFLLVASLVFYASWDWRFLLPLLFTTSVDFWVARRIEALAAAGRPQTDGRGYLLISIVSNLGLLGFFKYWNFFAGSAVDLARLLGFDLTLRTAEIILPLAISFYTFQALSYTIDVYRRTLQATPSFQDFFLAVLYFPHLIAGPIQRAAALLPQVTRPRRIVRQQVEDGLHLIAWGFFKKVFIADNLAPIADAAFSASAPAGGVTLLGVYAFTFQIYCDFSGYTDIARGLAKIMGFEFVRNFDLPYFAANPSDFWRRWHISLSTWMRDYVYKPLGGDRGRPSATYRNLLITMLLGGLWHGAAWTFVLWGLYHGALLALHRVLRPGLQRLGARMDRVPVPWMVVRVASMFVLTCYGWLLFRASSLDQIVAMTASLARPLDAIDWSGVARVSGLVAPLLLVQAIQARTGIPVFTRVPWMPAPARVVVYTLIGYLTIFRGGEPLAFVYFQF